MTFISRIQIHLFAKRIFILLFSLCVEFELLMNYFVTNADTWKLGFEMRDGVISKIKMNIRPTCIGALISISNQFTLSPRTHDNSHACNATASNSMRV